MYVVSKTPESAAKETQLLSAMSDSSFFIGFKAISLLPIIPCPCWLIPDSLTPYAGYAISTRCFTSRCWGKLKEQSSMLHEKLSPLLGSEVAVLCKQLADLEASHATENAGKIAIVAFSTLLVSCLFYVVPCSFYG